MSFEWSVDGEDLNTKPRTGGVIAEKGFTFQKAYALVRLTWLPTGERGLVELRYEGAQDVDLRFANGREVLTQAKDYKPGSLSYAVLKDVIAGFARDLITATARGRTGANLPCFRLVCTSAPYEQNSFEILRRVYIQQHAAAIEPLIQKKYREGLSDEQVLSNVQKVLEHGTFEIILHDEAIEDLKAQAAWNLVRFGVPPEHIQSSIASLLDALVPRRTFQVSDVVENLIGLPEGHPGNEGAACRMLPASRNLKMTTSMRTAFLRGAIQSLWVAVSNGLDIDRTESVDISRALLDVQVSGGVVVVEGTPGTGKSALIRRIAWDAHRTGTHLVLEVVVPAEVEEANWKAIINLLHLSAKPLLLVVDDIWRHRGFVEALERRIKPNLCILATSRPSDASQKSDLSMLHVHPVRLGRLSEELVGKLRDLVRLDEGTVAKIPPGQIIRFMEYGQLLALSLTLQGGSLDEFARDVLKPLRRKSTLKDFLGFCVAGQYDLAAPLSLFERLKPEDLPFWHDEDFFGLVSIQKTKRGPSRLKVGHSLVAQAIVKVDHVDIFDRTFYMCEICDAEIVEERRFLVHLLKRILTDPDLRGDLVSKGKRIAAAAQRLLEYSSFSDAHRLATMLTSVDQHELAQEFLAIATPNRIKDMVDVGLALSLKNHKDFKELYPRVFEFFEREPAAPGRRRLVKLTQEFGTSEQQIAVIVQTSNWAIRHNFPVDETLAALTLGNSAPDRLAAMALEPMIWAYIESEALTIETLNAAIWPSRRIRNIELSRALIEKALNLVRETDVWQLPQIDLVINLVSLVRPELDETSRETLATTLIKILGQLEERAKRVTTVRVAIVVGAIATRETIGNLICDMKALGWEEAEQLEKQLKHRFKSIELSLSS